jgi:hypothetical protein
MNDYLILYIEGKLTKEMFKVFTVLCQSVNISRKMIMKNKLYRVQMSDSNIMTSYLLKIIELIDQLFTIGVKIINEELVPIASNGFSHVLWEAFDQGVCACATLPTYEQLWDIFIQETR